MTSETRGLISSYVHPSKFYGALIASWRFYRLPAIRFHILTPFLVGKLVVLPPFRGAILPFEKNAEDFRIFFKKFFEQQNTPVRKARTGV